jgi:hypothetical protein
MKATRPAKLPAKVVRVLLLALPVLLTFAATALPAALLLSWLSGEQLTSPHNLSLAVTCGLIGWLFLAVFHVRTETVLLPVTDRQRFLATLVPVLKEMGYEVKAQGEGRVVSRPSFQALLMGGRLQVDLDGAAARVTGPKLFVEILRGRMRLQSLIARTHQTAREGRVRAGERLLKRVEISVRLTGEEGRGVCDEVVQALTREGAQVVCELHVMAQSEAGIREQTVEQEIRERLKERQLHAEIRKDHPRWEEPPPAPVDTTPLPARQ